jgi:hypothetical protein
MPSEQNIVYTIAFRTLAIEQKLSRDLVYMAYGVMVYGIWRYGIWHMALWYMAYDAMALWYMAVYMAYMAYGVIQCRSHRVRLNLSSGSGQ